MQPQAGGKPHPRLNTGERPIANKYREGKMKRTLRRESKALEIAGREALGARRLRARRDARRWSEGGRGLGRGARPAPPDGPAPPPHRPVHPGGTASVGSRGRQGGGAGPGGGACPSAAGRPAGRRPGGRGRGRPAPPSGGRRRPPRRPAVGRGPGTRRPSGRGRLEAASQP